MSDPGTSHVTTEIADLENALVDAENRVRFFEMQSDADSSDYWEEMCCKLREALREKRQSLLSSN